MHRIFRFTADSDRLNAMHTSTMLLSYTRRSKTLRSVGVKLHSCRKYSASGRVRSLNCIAAPFFRSARGGTRCKRHKARFLRFVRLPFRGAFFYFKLGSFPYLRK